MGCMQSKGWFLSGRPPLDPNSFATLQHFNVHRVIGEGGFGKVKAVTKRKEEGWYAMKVLNKDTVVNRKRVREVFQERDLLTYLNNPRICNLYFAFQDAKHLYLVMDIALGGDLRYQLNHNANGLPFSEARTRIYIAQCVLALQYIHSKNVIHRDIKPENLLLKSNGEIMLTDFGISRTLDSSGNCNSGSGTYGYMAPEQLCSDHRHGRPADWFSIGVTCHELLTSRRPFRSEKILRAAAVLSGRKEQDNSRSDMRRNFLSVTNSRLFDTYNISGACENLLNSLFRTDPSIRITESEILKHPWFQTTEEFDFKKIEDRTHPVPFLPNTAQMNAEPDADLSHLFTGAEEEKKIRLLTPEEEALFVGYEFDHRFNTASDTMPERTFAFDAVYSQQQHVAADSKNATGKNQEKSMNQVDSRSIPGARTQDSQYSLVGKRSTASSSGFQYGKQASPDDEQVSPTSSIVVVETKRGMLSVSELCELHSDAASSAVDPKSVHLVEASTNACQELTVT